MGRAKVGTTAAVACGSVWRPLCLLHLRLLLPRLNSYEIFLERKKG